MKKSKRKSVKGKGQAAIPASARETLPTQFELAQLAALLLLSKKWAGLCPKHLHGVDEMKLTAPDAALGLWEQCQDTLSYSLLEKLFSSGHFTIKSMGKKKMCPAWKEILEEGKFPVKFDDGLKCIVEIKRRDARHRAFRHFLYYVCRLKYKNDSEAESIAENLFGYFKAKGFAREYFTDVAEGFPMWKSIQATNKAKKAARVKWARRRAEQK